MGGTLTAKQVREAIERHSAWVIGNNRCFHDGAYEEIAAELNARAERTCRDASVDSSTQFYCSLCECTVDIPLLWGEVNYCPNCGRKVERGDA